ncbi:hypothetical protein BDR03DRAFT_998035 [Suillus americanus]|nr:hypothetical protein BDR03DRAFT_998035 [Suillus americanus]
MSEEEEEVASLRWNNNLSVQHSMIYSRGPNTLMAHGSTLYLPSAAPIHPALRSHLKSQVINSVPQIVKLLVFSLMSDRITLRYGRQYGEGLQTLRLLLDYMDGGVASFDIFQHMPEESLYALEWNNIIAVAVITLISYEYILQFDKEVTFVWERQWSVMTYLYLAVRYFGIFLAMICSYCYAMFLLMQWSYSVYFCLAEVVLIWRLYALHNQSKPLLYILLGLFLPIIAIYIAVDIFLWSRPSAISMQEITITPNIKYCTTFFHIGPMPAIYASIPVICYDIFLVVLAIAVLARHLRERKEVRMKPNAYVVTIVRYHVMYFILNLTSQIFMAMLWADLSTVVMNLILLFNNTAPFIVVPRLIISIWDTHANDNCVQVSMSFEDCVCWTSPPTLEQHEMDSSV